MTAANLAPIAAAVFATSTLAQQPSAAVPVTPVAVIVKVPKPW